MSEPARALVEVRGLTKVFPVRRGLLKRQVGEVRAVDGVDLDIVRGETLALVGESGSGKSTLGRLILRLLEPTSGSVRFDGVDVLSLPREPLRRMRRRMQIVFQDPYSSLNPTMTVRSIVREPLTIHKVGTRPERNERTLELLRLVGLKPELARRYPHELSGGERQRVGIARAIALDPEFLVADEPVTALDVSVQAQVLNLLLELQEKLSLTYLFIAHDLRVVEHVADRVAVMNRGKLVELQDRVDLFRAPRHEVTRELLASIPAG
jgi:ABC-type oligopeptide transport system ATPase subunit